MNIALHGSTVSLKRDRMIALRDASGSMVRCLNGTLWITERRGALDVILGPGETFTVAEELLAYGAQPQDAGQGGGGREVDRSVRAGPCITSRRIKQRTGKRLPTALGSQRIQCVERERVAVRVIRR